MSPRSTSRPSAQRRFYTTSEVARYCEVSNDGVLKWIKAGKLVAFATPGGHYRVSQDDFREFLERYKFPILDEFKDDATRLLVVDDDDALRELIVRRLHAEFPSWEIDSVSDGYEAGVRIGSQRPDLVLLDLVMPRVDGLALCRSIREHADHHRIGILTMSGAAEDRSRRQALEAGADGYLHKPIDFKLLRQTLERLLQRQSPTPSARVSGNPRLSGNLGEP